MKKVKLFCKTTLVLATMLLGTMNVWAAEAKLESTSTTSDQTARERTFSSNVGDNVVFSVKSPEYYCNSNRSKQYYYLKANTNATITWSVPDGYTIAISSVTVNANAQNTWTSGTRSWDIYTSVSTSSTKSTKSGNSFQDNTINTNEYLKNIGNSGNITLAHSDTEMQIKTITIIYTLVQNPDIRVTNVDLVNEWSKEIALADVAESLNGAGELIVGATTDAEVATYDAERSVFVLGHKSGSAKFSISADGVAEAKTFTITANQSFYAYAKGILEAGGVADADNFLDTTHNQAQAKAALATWRTTKMEALSGKDVDITYMLDNPGFQYELDWDYGWTGTNDETHSGDGSGLIGNVGDPMTGYQKKVDGSNIYPWIRRGNWGAYRYDLAEADVHQDVSLLTGYYRLNADIKAYDADGHNQLISTLYVKDASDNVLGSTETKCSKSNVFTNVFCGFVLASGQTVTVGESNNADNCTAQREVAVDNFSLTYVCDKATYDAYMVQYNRANGLKDKPKLLTALNTALKDAQKDILTLAGADIANQTETLKNACDAAEAHINWVSVNVTEVVNKNNMYLHLYPQTDAPLSVLSRGADYGTRAIVTNSGLKLNVQTNNETLISTVTFTDTDKKLFVTTDNAVYTDYNNNGDPNFYFVSVEGGYKIVLASDHDKALYVTVGTYEGVDYNVVMTTTLDDADIWCFANEVSASVSISDAEWATYYNSQWAFIVPTGLTAVVAVVENSAFKLVKDAYTAGSTVPAGEAVLLNGEAGTYTLNFVETSGTRYEGNLLKGSDDVLPAEAMETANPGDNYFYGLSLNAEGDVNSIGFYWMNESGAAFDNAAHKAYLVLPQSFASAPSRFVFGPQGVPTDLESVNPSTNSEQTQCKKLLVNGVLYILRDGKTYDSFGRMVK